jgi:hypothetical protein
VNEPLTATRVILQFHAQHSLDPAGQQASLDSLRARAVERSGKGGAMMKTCVLGHGAARGVAFSYRVTLAHLSDEKWSLEYAYL